MPAAAEGPGGWSYVFSFEIRASAPGARRDLRRLLSTRAAESSGSSRPASVMGACAVYNHRLKRRLACPGAWGTGATAQVHAVTDQPSGLLAAQAGLVAPLVKAM